MKVFTGDKNSIKKQLDILLTEFQKCYNITDGVLLLFSIVPLIELYYDYFNCSYEDIKLIKQSEKYNSILNRASELIKDRSDSFIENKAHHLDFSSSIMSSMLDYLKDFNEDCSTITEDYLYKIVSEYYLNTSDNDGIKILDALMKDKRLYNINALDDNTYAATIMDYYDKKGNIITFSENNLKKTMMTILVHEVEHIKEMSDIESKNSKVDSFSYQYNSIYSEVLAIKAEKDFLEYLIENNIEKEYAINELNKNYLTTFTFLKQMMFLSILDNDLLEDDRYTEYSREELVEIYRKKGLDIENMELLSNLNLNDEILYSYGGVLGTYFSYLEKSDPCKYSKVMDKFKQIRTTDYNECHLQMLGTNIDELGQIVRCEMTKYQKVQNKNYRK